MVAPSGRTHAPVPLRPVTIRAPLSARARTNTGGKHTRHAGRARFVSDECRCHTGHAPERACIANRALVCRRRCCTLHRRHPPQHPAKNPIDHDLTRAAEFETPPTMALPPLDSSR